MTLTGIAWASISYVNPVLIFLVLKRTNFDTYESTLQKLTFRNAIYMTNFNRISSEASISRFLMRKDDL